jgi:hypothetical protein
MTSPCKRVHVMHRPDDRSFCLCEEHPQINESGDPVEVKDVCGWKLADYFVREAAPIIAQRTRVAWLPGVNREEITANADVSEEATNRCDNPSFGTELYGRVGPGLFFADEHRGVVPASREPPVQPVRGAGGPSRLLLRAHVHNPCWE